MRGLPLGISNPMNVAGIRKNAIEGLARVSKDRQAFDILAQALEKPAPFSAYTAERLWTDPHTSGQMLKLHLDTEVDVSSSETM